MPKHFDIITGLVYYNYGYCSSELGRWLNRDPIGEQGGLNLYLALNNNLLNNIDYLGLHQCDRIGEIDILSTSHQFVGTGMPDPKERDWINTTIDHMMIIDTLASVVLSLGKGATEAAILQAMAHELPGKGDLYKAFVEGINQVNITSYGLYLYTRITYRECEEQCNIWTLFRSRRRCGKRSNL